MARFQAETVSSLMDLVAAAGLDTPAALGPEHIFQRVGTNETVTFSQLYPLLEPGELCQGARDPWYREQWRRARPDSFTATA